MKKLSLSLIFLCWVGSSMAEAAPKAGAASENLSHRTGILSSRKITPTNRDRVQKYGDDHQDRFRPDRFAKLAEKDAAAVGNILTDLSVIAWATDSQSARAQLEEWVRMSADYAWGAKRNDRQNAGLLFGLSVAYDWHGKSWAKDLPPKVRSLMKERAKIIFDAAEARLSDWGQSHWHYRTWMNYSALLAAGLSLWKDQPDASFWARTAADRLELVLSYLPEDGSHHEGLTFTTLGNVWLVRAAAMLEPAKPSIFADSAYLRSCGTYHETLSRLSLTAPKVNPAEAFVKLCLAYPASRYAILARKYLEEEPFPGLLWTAYGEPASAEETADKDAHFFEDRGLYIEPHYEGDRLNDLLAFKSGPPGGRKARSIAAKKSGAKLTVRYDHPDQNEFFYEADGVRIFSDTAKREKRWSADHSTLLVGWTGQIGEGRELMGEESAKGPAPNAGLTKERIFRKEGMSIVSAEAAAYYPPSTGLKRYERFLVWLKGVGLLVLDDVRCSYPVQLQFAFHSDREMKDRGVKILYPADAEVVAKFDGGYRMTTNFKMSREEDQEIALVTDRGITAALSQAGNTHRVVLGGGSGYEVYFRRDETKPMTIGALSVDAPLAVVLVSSLDPTSQEWVVYRARAVRSGERIVWDGAGKAGILQFGYNAKLGLSAEVREV